MFNSTLHDRAKFAFFCVKIFILIFCFLPLKSHAFDGASEINHSYLNQENFLDLKSYQFNKLHEEKWYESEGGWRLTGGSLGMDLLYSQLEVRLPHTLNEEITVKFIANQEEFYEIKPFRYQVEVEWRPFDLIAFSLLGMPEYDKRKADQGVSISMGERPWNYLRFQKLYQDLYYNEKNFYDSSFYSSHPIENHIEGAIRINKWRARFSHLVDEPFEQVFPDQEMIFSYKGQDSRAVLDYHFGKNSISGLSSRSFNISKRRESKILTDYPSPDNRDQKLIYRFVDLYVLRPISSKIHLTLGLREDLFQNIFRQLDQTTTNYDFHLWTAQIYGILRYQTNAQRFWEYAIFVGDTEKVTDFLSDVWSDKKRRKNEAKLRVSWEIQDLISESALLLTTTWNVDNFLNNFWDGGNISYQYTF